MTEREISDLVHAEMTSRSLGSAWSYDSCPGVKFGPNTREPGGNEIEPGFVASVDLRVSYADYCSDLQRMWYLRKPGEQNVPEVVSQAFAAVKGAIEAGKAVLKPGVQGWQVDAAAREYLVQAGYPENQHALGYGVGRYAHDGGPILGPRWARHGETPYYTIEEGLVFTLELGVMTERGYVSQEDEVIVTAQGCEWFSQPQDAIYVV